MTGQTLFSEPARLKVSRPTAAELTRRFFFLVDAIARDHEPTTTQLDRLASSYEGTAQFLANRDEFEGLLLKIHPHGSRQLGTMVRPTRSAHDGFDVDLIALLSTDARRRYMTSGGPALLLNDFYRRYGQVWCMSG